MRKYHRNVQHGKKNVQLEVQKKKKKNRQSATQHGEPGVSVTDFYFELDACRT